MKEIGEELKTRRLELGLGLADISEATKIKYNYLKALEEGDRKNLPADVYTKGFLRSYGDYLGMDGQHLVTRYKRIRELEIGAEETQLPIKEPTRVNRQSAWQPRPDAMPALPHHQRIRRRKARQRRNSRSLGLGLGAMIVILLAIFIYSGSIFQSEPASQNSNPPSTGTGMDDSFPQDHGQNGGEGDIGPDADGDHASEPQNASPTVELETTESTRVSQTTLVKNTELLELHLTVHQDCWIGAYVDGELAWEKTLTNGEEEVLTAEERIYLIIGFPPALQMTVNGQNLPEINVSDVYRLTLERG